MEATDQILVGRLARQGDHAAFCTLLSRYADMVYSTSLRILRDDSLAADVTQETFFQLFKSAGRITGSPGGWLHQVATRRAIDLVRQNVARRRREHTYAQEQDGPATSWAEVAPLVDTVLEELPEEHREMLIQHFLERKSMGQIAAAKGISQPTVSRRVAEGLEWMRERLRLKGVGIGVVPLQSLLVHTAESAPESLLRGLGKVALAQAASTPPAAAGASLLGSTGALAFTAAAAAVAVAFNVLLPDPQWGPTQPPPRAARPQAAATNLMPVVRTSSAAAVLAEAPPAAPILSKPDSYALGQPAIFVRATNGPPMATNSPATQAAGPQTAGPVTSPTQQDRANQFPFSANPAPAYTFPSRPLVGNRPVIRSRVETGMSQVDRRRTNSSRDQPTLVRSSAFPKRVVLGPASPSRAGKAAPSRSKRGSK